MAIVVQKYGGSSVADVEHIRKVADRVAATQGGGQGRRGGGLRHGRHHRRAAGAGQAGDARTPRGASWTCCSPPASASRWRCSPWRCNARGVPAVSFTGSQSGIVTNDSHTNARIVEVRPVPRAGRAGPRQGRDRRRLPGRVLQARGHDARPRRLRHHRGRAGRGARRRGLRDLQRRGRRLHRRPARGARPRAGWPSSRTRRCRSWRSRGPRS